MEKRSVNKKEIKKLFREKGFRITNKNIDKLIDLSYEFVLFLIEKAIRNARISGRKTIKPLDIKGT